MKVVQSSHTLHMQFPLLLTSYISVVELSQWNNIDILSFTKVNILLRFPHFFSLMSFSVLRSLPGQNINN